MVVEPSSFFLISESRDSEIAVIVVVVATWLTIL